MTELGDVDIRRELLFRDLAESLGHKFSGCLQATTFIAAPGRGKVSDDSSFFGT